jgi:hypothetical protein
MLALSCRPHARAFMDIHESSINSVYCDACSISDLPSMFVFCSYVSSMTGQFTDYVPPLRVCQPFPLILPPVARSLYTRLARGLPMRESICLCFRYLA